MAKSWIIKAFLLSVITVLMVFVLTSIYVVIEDRGHYRDEAQQKIEDTWSGEQYLLGPVLQVPYQVKVTTRTWDEKSKQYQLHKKLIWRYFYELAENISIDTELQTEERQLGIHRLPVFTTAVELEGQFILPDFEPELASNEVVEQLGRPQLQIIVADVRGLATPKKALWQGQNVTFEPGSQFENIPAGMHALLPQEILENRGMQEFSIHFDLRGSRSLNLLLSGQNTEAMMKSNWPHPGFGGRYSPLKHEISAEGFTANWAVSSLAANTDGLLDECLEGHCYQLFEAGFLVQLVSPVDLQRMLSRSLKYGILFILLTYISFFLFEIISGQPLHPIQYLLVGSALTVFYLLLTALAEQLGFGISYFIAAIACSSLLGFYLLAILPKQWQAWLYAGITLALYGLLFVILSSEDSALLMGALLVFIALSSVMLLTRRIDWYALENTFSSKAKQEKI